MSLAKEIVEKAFRAENGELAWKCVDALPAVKAILENRNAILGGEVWLVKDSEIQAMVPRDSAVPAVYSWTAEGLDSKEDWDSFVERCAELSIKALEDLPDEDAVIPEEFEVYYNFTWISESEYELLDDL